MLLRTPAAAFFISVLLYAPAGLAGEAATGRWLRHRVEPVLVEEPVYYVLAGREEEGKPCFVNVESTPDNVNVNLEYARERNLPMSSPKYRQATRLRLETKKEHNWQQARYEETAKSFTVDNAESKIPGRQDLATLEVFTQEDAAKDYRGFKSARVRTIRKVSGSPEDEFDVERICIQLKTLARVSAKSGAGLAVQAAKAWNAQNPADKVPPNQFQFLGCEGYDQGEIECLANGPWMEDSATRLRFRYKSTASGTMGLSSVELETEPHP
jgi:hypothetical protein